MKEIWPSFWASTLRLRKLRPALRSLKLVLWWCCKRNQDGEKFSLPKSPLLSGNKSCRSSSGNLFLKLIRQIQKKKNLFKYLKGLTLHFLLIVQGDHLVESLLKSDFCVCLVLSDVFHPPIRHSLLVVLQSHGNLWIVLCKILYLRI